MIGRLAFKRDSPEVKHICAQDGAFRRLVDLVGDVEVPRRSPDVFEALVRSIVGQQLSGKAAAAIWARIQALCGGGPHGQEFAALRTDSEVAGLEVAGPEVAGLVTSTDCASGDGSAPGDCSALGDRSSPGDRSALVDESTAPPTAPQTKAIVTPSRLSAFHDDTLRAAGLSRPKVTYVRDLCRKVQSGEIDPDGVRALSDDDLVATLTQVKGIGEWTCQMLMIFSLGRMDVFAPADLVLRKGVQWLYGLEEVPRVRELLTISERWKPYRTVASLYLWEVANLPSGRPKV